MAQFDARHRFIITKLAESFVIENTAVIEEYVSRVHVASRVQEFFDGALPSLFFYFQTYESDDSEPPVSLGFPFLFCLPPLIPLLFFLSSFPP